MAARFDTTPSELTGLNKLNSAFIFPGQQLLVPDKSGAGDEADADGGSGSGSLEAGGGDRSRKTSSDEIPIEEKGEFSNCFTLVCEMPFRKYKNIFYQ